MPTGYTAGILDGTTKTFRGFAYQCVRNFGAAIHMRDEPLDKPYEPAEMSSYHIGEITRLEEQLEALEDMSDEDLLGDQKRLLLKDFNYYRERLRQNLKDRATVALFLEKAKAFEAPTEDHNGIADFMVSQLEDEVNSQDSDTEYYIKGILRLLDEIEDLDATRIRASRIESIKDSMSYHLTQKNADHKRVVERNKWVNDFFDSLEEMEGVTEDLSTK